ncbi:MAG: transporter [Actinomycetota bacterium]|nr:transporter [Actinomycetota bacterium]
MAKRLLVLVCAVLLMESFFSAVLTPLVPAYRNELGLTDGATGILVAAYAAGSLLLALPAGWFASRFNPRKAVIVGLLGVGVSSVLFGFAGQLAVLEVSRFLLGAFGTLLWAGGLSWAISSTPVANRGQVMGTLLAAAVAGELVGPPVGALADEVGTEWVFGGMLVLALLLVALARTVPPAAEADGQTAREAARAVTGSGVRAWLLAMIAVIGPSIALGSILLLAPLRFDDLGLSAWLLAGMFLAMSVVEMIVGPIVGRVSDRRGRRKPYLIGLAIMASCLVPVAFVTSPWVLAALLAVYSAGSGFAFTTSMTMVTDLATRAGLNQGYSSAASAIGWAGGVITGAILGGLLVGAVGYLGGVLALVAMIVTIGVVTLRRAEGGVGRVPNERALT